MTEQGYVSSGSGSGRVSGGEGADRNSSVTMIGCAFITLQLALTSVQHRAQGRNGWRLANWQDLTDGEIRGGKL
jgi:hypothetical protein